MRMLPKTYAHGALAVLFAIMPVAIMTGQNLPSGIYYASLLLALATLAQGGARQTLHRYRTLLIVMATPTLVALFSAAWHRHIPGADLEMALRLWSAVLVFVPALTLVADRHLKNATWGFAVAAMAASGYILWLSWPDFIRPDTTRVYNAVGYGNLTLLLAVFVLFSACWTLTRRPRLECALKLLIAACTLGAFVLTQTRSGWVAVPAFAIIAGVLLLREQHKNAVPRALLLATALFAAMATVFLSSDTLRERAVMAYTEAVECRGEQRIADTSICIRLQLWRAALDITAQNPIAGMGDKRLFSEALNDDALPKGLVSAHVAEGWGEPHNDVMLALATFGIPGGLALLLVYLAPAWVFARRLALRHPQTVRTAAAMGLTLCLGFFIFGLTETMLRGMRTASYYAMCMALFLVLSDPDRRRMD